MRARFVFMILPMFLSGAALCVAHSSQAPWDQEPELSLSLTGPRNAVAVGAPVMVRLMYKNTSDRVAHVTGPGVRVEVTDSQGKSVPFTPYGRKLYGPAPPRSPSPGPRTITMVGSPPSLREAQVTENTWIWQWNTT